jgi:S-DNA-T family DNA segregation ATPase FtsK/SpoIIIE
MAIATPSRPSAFRSRRDLASPALRQLMRRRLAELGGILLGLLGLAILVALAAYNPHDPSLDTASAGEARNLAGPLGAILSDLLLQGFGIAAALPGLAMLAWAWRIASHRGLASPVFRLAALLAALPVLAAVAATLPARGASAVLAWPTQAGPGGAIGQALAHAMLAAGRGLLGPFGEVLVWVLGAALAALLIWLSLGLSAGEWRAASHAAFGAARLTYGQGRRAGGLLSGAGRAIFRLFAPLARLIEGTPPLPVARPVSVAPAPSRPVAQAPSVHAPLEPTAESPVARTKIIAAPRRPLPLRQEALPLGEPGWVFP